MRHFLSAFLSAAAVMLATSAASPAAVAPTAATNIRAATAPVATVTAPVAAAATPAAMDTTPATAAATSAAGGATLATPPEDPHGCLKAGNGFLRAKIRGAVNLDIDLHNGELQCEGGPRPNGSGVRVSFAGPRTSDGRRLRMVFGVGTATEGRSGHALPTNLTVIFEGEQRVFATRGQDRCTVDQLEQERLGALGGPVRTYRVLARGFCVSPATALDDRARILVSTFDFAGRVTFEDAP